MNDLTVKEVNFNGNTLVAAQDKETEKVYVGVRWVCAGIGFSRGQLNNEVKKVQEDIVLKKLARNLMLDTGYGFKDVLCIELEGLPLWLAKVSITPKMQKEAPETVEKLVEYQLKAKDVLANAFIHNQTQIVPKTYKEALLALVEKIEETEKLEAEKQILLPKAESFDLFIDGSNVQKMNQVAKALGIGRNKLFEFLRSQKVLMKDNTPYQRFIDNGYFVVKENPVKKGIYIHNVTQTFVTSKGVDYIGKLLKKNVG